jgi:GGDEF domain-containing protein
VAIDASIGVALSLADGVTSDAIIRNADLALYAAKDAGKGCHH